jgi:hypothetical protein
MTTVNILSPDERASNHSLTALTLLADPTSTLFDRDRLAAIADIALREDHATTRNEIALLLNFSKDLRWLRAKLKQAFTFAYAYGDIEAATAQCLIDRCELWAD